MSDRSSFRSSAFFLHCEILLLLVTLLAPIFIMRRKSITFDEVSHLPAGYSYWVRRSVQYNQQHPPLIKEICALPLFLAGIKSTKTFPENEWIYGQNFLFGPSADASRITFLGRLPVVLIATGLAFLVLAWTRALWGRAAGILSLCLYTFDPTITAHSQVVTTDVGVAFFSALYLFSLRRYLARRSTKRLIVTGVLLGLALGSKFSAVVLLPITICLVLIVAVSQRPDTAETLSNATLGSQSDATGPPAAGFRGSSQSSLEGMNKRQRLIVSELISTVCLFGLASVVVWFLYMCPKDPLFYWRGIQLVHQDHPANSNFYLMGSLKPGGWKLYLLVAWLVKTPIPSMILLGAAVVMFFRGRRSSLLDEAFLIIPALGFFIFYSIFGDNIGVRYLIPCFPFFFIFTGRLVTEIARCKRVYKLALASLLIWYLTEYVAIMPDHLSYFNQIAGGPEGGIEWLDNSNVDWGQGLFQLRDFIEGNGIEDYAFFYFGVADPTYYGIHGRRIEDFSFMLRPTYGTVILSAHGIPRARDVLKRAFGDGPLNWLKHTRPWAIVGHAYYVYEIR